VSTTRGEFRVRLEKKAFVEVRFKIDAFIEVRLLLLSLMLVRNEIYAFREVKLVFN